jgi:hypothetical protein
MTKLLTFTILILSCFTLSKGLAQGEKSNPIQKRTYRLSSNKDSVVLVGEPPFHFGLQIFRKKKIILDYANNELQINSTDAFGNDANWFAEHKNGSERFYIIRVFTGPQPDQFLIIKVTDIKATVFGITETNSAEIFGDVDHDGKFEIGGLTLFCQGGDPNCHPVDHCRVFEIAEGFPTDTALTKS